MCAQVIFAFSTARATEIDKYRFGALSKYFAEMRVRFDSLVTSIKIEIKKFVSLSRFKWTYIFICYISHLIFVFFIFSTFARSDRIKIILKYRWYHFVCNAEYLILSCDISSHRIIASNATSHWMANTNKKECQKRVSHWKPAKVTHHRHRVCVISNFSCLAEF